MNEQNMPHPGKYTGKLLDWGIGKTQAGLPQILCLFDFVDDYGGKWQQIWTGSLKEGKARGFTMETLKVCGLQQGARLSTLADGKDAGALKAGREVQLTVAHETYTDNKDGLEKTRWRIQWVNAVGGPMMANRLGSQEAASLLGETGFADQPPLGQDDEVPF